ncbi:MAG TPA: tetratricopeptide repeat protein [Drouetiella sp.]
MASALAGNPQWEQATKLYNSGDYRAALSAFQKISEKNPSEPRAHYMLAQCYKSNGNTKQAIAELEWITNATSDQSVKGPAASLLAQLKGSRGPSSSASVASMPQYVPQQLGPHGLKPMIPNAISPYSIPPGGFNSGAINDHKGPIH